jgi:hypothetical protein
MFREVAGWMPWLKEKTGITSRRWRTVLFGRKKIDDFLDSEVRACTYACQSHPQILPVWLCISAQPSINTYFAWASLVTCI